MADDSLKPLNHGELGVVCEQYCALGTPNNMNEEDLVTIMDAECNLVCFVPRSKAAMMVRLLNSYEPVIEDDLGDG